jgi:hypothetical protein
MKQLAQRALFKPLLLGACSGFVWAGIGYWLGDRQPVYIGGVLTAPVIGVLAALSSRWFGRCSRLGKSLFSGVALYAAAFLFVLASGTYAWYAGNRTPESLVSVSAMVAFIGLTYTGAALVLWPLAYWNFSLVARYWNPGPGGGTRRQWGHEPVTSIRSSMSCAGFARSRQRMAANIASFSARTSGW